MTLFNDRVLNATTRQVMPVATYPGAALVGHTIEQMVRDPAIQAKVSLALRKEIGLDFYQSAMDLSAEAEAFGAQVRIVGDEVPTVIGRLVTTPEQIRALAIPKVGAGRTNVYLDTMRILAKEPGSPFTVGGCIGPFTLAGRLFGVSESLEFSMNEPEAMEELIDKSATFLIEYVKAFKAAGAKCLFMAEPTAGLLSPKMLGRFSSAYIKRIVDAVESDGFGIILHNCGAKIAHIPQVLQSGATAFHFGQPMDLIAAAKQVPANVVVCGNLDPAGCFVNLPTADLISRTCALAAAANGVKNLVMSSGCDLPPGTSFDNLRAYMETAKG